jgi:hypothetical protein
VVSRDPIAPTGWYLLIHQIPPRPLYLRAKIRRRLARVGAAAVKNSVYVLPEQPACLEDFQWLAKEIVDGGGDACVCVATFVDGLTRDDLVRRFHADAAARYRPVAAALEAWRRASDDGRRADRRPDLATIRRQFDEIARTDFFRSSAGRTLEAVMTATERSRSHAGTKPRAATGPDRTALTGRVWVTRADPHVDRLASAWLVRRFVDATATFRFVAPGGRPKPGEVSFDMPGATFSHEQDRCTFETLVTHLGIDDGALGQVAEIVHDVDLKDGKFGRPDADGIRQLVVGLTGAHPDSAARVEQALPLFDALYASFGGRPGPRPAGTARRRGRSAGASRRSS